MADRSLYLLAGYACGLIATLFMVSVAGSPVEILAGLMLSVVAMLAVALLFERSGESARIAANGGPEWGSPPPAPPASSAKVDTPASGYRGADYGRDAANPASAWRTPLDDVDQGRTRRRDEGTVPDGSHTRPRRPHHSESPEFDRDSTAPLAADVVAAPVDWEKTLLQAWTDYRRTGDGHFNADGLRRYLLTHGLTGAEVTDGSRVGANDSVLAVRPTPASVDLYLLPAFTKPQRAVQEWFDDRSGGALTARTQNLLDVAIVTRTEKELRVVKRGGIS